MNNNSNSSSNNSNNNNFIINNNIVIAWANIWKKENKFYLVTDTSRQVSDTHSPFVLSEYRQFSTYST